MNTSKNEVFSLAQQWYVGGSGSSLQTVEGGWQVFPAQYHTSKAALFIYWTADDYHATGCYNLTCPGFVQINKNWFLGGTFRHYSTAGGTVFHPWPRYSQSGDQGILSQGRSNVKACGDTADDRLRHSKA